jgi:hypothetical protein
MDGSVRPSFLALIWLGLVIGVSFVATPVKFTAPSLDLPTALEVGRVTFRLLARIEWLLALVLVASTWGRRQRLPWSGVVVLAIVVIEASWLLPSLGARTDAIRSGATPPESSLHTVFIAAELLKCVALAHCAIVLARGERTR